ncbi:hypothetical protein KPH14_004578 [Odynerus spinipes]|uniref:Uncharacterized protein n=1 Tax=Odynerus spinipes TaxID=1348599 RepID=A0AAD9RN71_9HYME|nr:hypothetical protein KPH14_004578 [Odynerus spinipes]
MQGAHLPLPQPGHAPRGSTWFSSPLSYGVPTLPRILYLSSSFTLAPKVDATNELRFGYRRIAMPTPGCGSVCEDNGTP